MTYDNTDPASEPDILLPSLRKGIWKLSSLDRRLVALHFGAGLSQAAIARLLEMPCQIIAFRIRRALKHLCGWLARDGFKTEMDAERLRVAVCSGIAVPRELSEKIQRRLFAPATFRRGNVFHCFSSRVDLSL